MNKISIVFLAAMLFFAAAPVYAQKAKEKALKETCDCLAKVEKGADLQAALQQCMLPAWSKDMVGLLKAYGFSATDLNSDNGRQIGEQMGKQFAQDLMSMCPAFTQMAMNAGIEAQATKSSGSSGTVKGTIVKVKEDGMAFLIITDETGDEQSLLILRPFEGSDEGLHEAVGKQVTVKWKTVEIYSPKDKAYKKFKEIISME